MYNCCLAMKPIRFGRRSFSEGSPAASSAVHDPEPLSEGAVGQDSTVCVAIAASPCARRMYIVGEGMALESHYGHGELWVLDWWGGKEGEFQVYMDPGNGMRDVTLHEAMGRWRRT